MDDDLIEAARILRNADTHAAFETSSEAELESYLGMVEALIKNPDLCARIAIKSGAMDKQWLNEVGQWCYVRTKDPAQEGKLGTRWIYDPDAGEPRIQPCWMCKGAKKISIPLFDIIRFKCPECKGTGIDND